MSKKSMILAAVAALAIVAVAVAVLVISRKPSPPVTPTTNPSTSTTAPSTTTSGTAGAPGQVATGTATTTGTPVVGTPEKPGILGPFPELPDPKLPGSSPSAPIAKGKVLAPLIKSPANTISALQDGAVPNGTKYLVVLRPYGIGPSNVLGTRIVVHVDTTKPKSKFISNVNLLVVADTLHGGGITKGGIYSATITMVSDGAKLIPVLSLAKAQ